MGFKISLKAARINAGLTQEDAAKKIGVSKQSLSNWECGRNTPKATELMGLCEIYGVPAEMLSLSG